MNHKFYSTSAAVVVLLGAAGCGSAPVRIDTASNQGITTVHQIDFKDWQIAAEKGINSMLESGAMKRADGRKTILMISNVKNSTTESVNTRILTDKIRQAVLRSGQAVVTTAVGAQGAEESYFFIHMVLTDLATGLAMWEDNVEIAKQGTKSIFD